MELTTEHVTGQAADTPPARRSAKSLLLEGLLTLLPIAVLYWLEYRVYGGAIRFHVALYGPICLLNLFFQRLIKPREPQLDHQAQTAIVAVLCGILALAIWLNRAPYAVLTYHTLALLAALAVSLIISRNQYRRTGKLRSDRRFGENLGIAVLLTAVSLLYVACVKPVTVAQAEEAIRLQGDRIVELYGHLSPGLAHSLTGTQPLQEEGDRRGLDVYWFVVERDGALRDVFIDLMDGEIIAEQPSMLGR